MSFLTMIFIVSILGAVIGVNKPWRGAIPGLLSAPFLFHIKSPPDIFAFTISVVFLVLFGLAYGYISSIIISGIKGGGDRVGQSYMGGFGAHHPGGLILSNEDIKSLNEIDIRSNVFFSY